MKSTFGENFWGKKNLDNFLPASGFSLLPEVENEKVARRPSIKCIIEYQVLWLPSSNNFVLCRYEPEKQKTKPKKDLTL